jgi:orotate phosphoribosyltransferase-like protein
MSKSKTTMKQELILFRQQQVLSLAGDGFTEREIATKLQVSDTTVHRDLTLLKQQAKEEIREYIDKRVPFEFHKTLIGLEGIIKSMANIISNSSDNKEIMNASTIKMQAYNMRMELVANANLVSEAVELVDKYRGYTGQKAKVTIDVTDTEDQNIGHDSESS